MASSMPGRHEACPALAPRVGGKLCHLRWARDSRKQVDRPNTLAAITARKAGFRSLSAEAATDRGTGNGAVAAIGGSLILLWFLSPRSCCCC